MVGNANVRIDEFVDKSDVERKKEPEDYDKFVYVYDETPGRILELQQRDIELQIALHEN